MTAHAGSADRVVCAPSDRRPAVVDTIRAARQRLSLSLFRCDDQEVLDALADAVRRGVHVRALITSRAKGSKKLLTQLEDHLRAVGVEVRRYSDRVVRYHAKYIVADDGPALIASLNFTEKCFTHTCDFILVTRDQGLVAGLNDLFMADWDGLPPGTRPSTTDRLIVGPEQARSRFATLLTQAVSRIRLIDPKLDDPAMLALLKARASAGVEVDIRGTEDVGTLVPHGKLLLIDDSIAVIGSISLSILALEFRRELAAVISDGESLTTLEEFWRSLPRRLPQPARIA
jgi:cardiolipin synthase A/B